MYYTYMGEQGQQELRPREQNIADFKDFITKFYPANQQQTFIYRFGCADRVQPTCHACLLEGGSQPGYGKAPQQQRVSAQGSLGSAKPCITQQFGTSVPVSP